MDCQTGIVSIYAKGEKDAFLTRAAAALNHARAIGMMVIHVQVGFRPGLPEVSSRNPLFSAIKSSPERQQLFQGALAAFPPEIAPKETEVVITKHRISAFTGTDLAMILRANDIDTLILLGIATRLREDEGDVPWKSSKKLERGEGSRSNLRDRSRDRVSFHNESRIRVR